MIRELIYQASETIYHAIKSLQTPQERAASDVVIHDGVIVSEPPHDEAISEETEEQRAKNRAIQQYHEHAEELCAKNKREGVWIELLLLGVQISSIREGELDGEQFHFRLKSKPTTVIVPNWCVKVMNQDDINWKVDRKTIHRCLGKHEIIPEDVFKLSPSYEE